jgi:signal transduction histidine kinase
VTTAEYQLAQAAPNASVLSRIARRGVAFILLGFAYYGAVELGLGFRFENSHIGVVWIANAVLLSALLLTPYREWGFVLGITAIAHIAAMNDVAPSWRWSWQIAGNAVFAISMVALLRRFAGMPLQFANRRQLFVYMAVAFGVPALFALVMPAFVRSLLGLDTTFNPLVSWLRTYLSNATALLLVTPAILLWADGGFRRLRSLSISRVLEAIAIMVFLMTAGVLAFGTLPATPRYPSVLLWILPPLLWAAVRFGPLAAATTLCSAVALSMLGTARELGPFVLATEADWVLSLQLFWLVLSAPVMLLAASIREREQAEAALLEQRNQLAHVTRVATVGELSGALAHELRQPLTAILANAQAGMRLLRTGQADLPEIENILGDIVQNDKQAEGVIDRLRAFLKNTTPQAESVAFDGVVRDALALAHGAIVITGIEVETEAAPDLPPVIGDRVQLLQVVLNLVVNGCESMHHVPSEHRKLGLRLRQLPEAGLELQVSDRGPGLPWKGKMDVFKPFFTTKENGLGLGLAIARYIVDAHGGQLWGANNTDGGATFHLQLPIREPVSVGRGPR